MGKKKSIIVENYANNSKYDSAWKKVIQKLFKDFLEFFFPVIHHSIDFSKEIQFLDKELKEIDPDSTIGDRVADVLAKVHLKDGSIKYIGIIIHVEVQGEPQKNFMERMFIYYYRAFDKEKEENIPIISVALLTDDNESYRPNEFSFSLFGFELKMKIPIVKIIDFKLNQNLKENLETSNNPMSMIVKAQLKSHEVKKEEDEKKFIVTKELIRQCYQHGYSRHETKIVLNFFDWVIRLPETYKEKIKHEIIKAEEEYKMEYVSIWERDWLKKGEEIGEKRGEIRGEKRGILKTTKDTARKMLLKGFDIETIAEITGLKKSEIDKLKNKQH